VGQLPWHEVWPVLLWNLLPGQYAHIPRLPAAAALLPAGQGAQTVPPLAYWPAGQVSATAVHEVALRG
jgi:hypothetical protein